MYHNDVNDDNDIWQCGRWRLNTCYRMSISNHRQLDGLINTLSRLTLKNTPKLHIASPPWWQYIGYRLIPSQSVCNAESISISDHHWIQWWWGLSCCGCLHRYNYRFDILYVYISQHINRNIIYFTSTKMHICVASKLFYRWILLQNHIMC